ncbi:hypothetical protein SAMN04488104_100240 [Algoriphagus faecimaris]|uniref:Transcription elongation factor, GreA/GreB, C-term n=1 Tax=Algoriphagus faecimaris TaxID=686796 RepID=A0A1G6MSI8_9BACT|nr:hypothetical protein [Algoriphagus faecimaris]SDC58509.1 hypothetical protein SAMN04488104_100240 [Algoriphagus faecimaris]
MSLEKESLFKAAITALKAKIEELKSEQKAISDGILEDNKSSAGDKFETSREMLTQDLRQVENQIEKNQEDLEELYRIQAIKNTQSEVKEGSLIKLGTEWFLISISFGLLNFENEKVFLLSKNAPLGQLLLGKKENEEVLFRGKPHPIVEIH